MRHKELPERWAQRLKVYLTRIHGSDRDHLSATDFNPGQNVKINFEDGSSAFFCYAFYLADKELDEVAVFTEHCGYHIFYLSGARFELLESLQIVTGIE